MYERVTHSHKADVDLIVNPFALENCVCLADDLVQTLEICKSVFTHLKCYRRGMVHSFELTHLLWTFRDAIFYFFEVVAYALQALLKACVQGAVAIVEWVDEQFDDLEIADEPLARGLIMGAVGLLVGVGLVMLLAMVRNQPWVIVTFVVTGGEGIGLGLLADPERDWTIGRCPSLLGGQVVSPSCPSTCKGGSVCRLSYVPHMR